MHPLLEQLPREELRRLARLGRNHPLLEQLPREELRRLGPVKLTGIRAVGDPWRDDNEICTAVELGWADRTEHTISICWISPKAYAALVYANDCKRAWVEAVSIVRSGLPDRLRMSAGRGPA
jgi:hypothetical protein